MWRRGRVALVLWVAALAVSALFQACSLRRPPATLHDLAEAYVRIALQFAQHRPNLVDAWIGPATARPGPRVPVADLRTSLGTLVARADAVTLQDIDATEAPRLTYLRGQLRALTLVARRLLGESTRFEEDVHIMFGVPLPQPDQAGLARARVALDQELPGAGPLADRYASFRRQFVIPDDRIDRVLAAAITACQTATAQHVTLPADQAIAIEFDPSVEWDAYAEYVGDHHTRVRIASRTGHDVAALLHLACHETYAGHHLQHILIDDALVKGRGWTEFQLTPAFGPHLLISEGAAEAGVDLALPEPARASLYRDRLLPLAGLAAGAADRLARVETLAARLESAVPAVVARYLDDGAKDAGEALRESVLMPSPQRFMAFAERHRTAAVVYPLGKEAVTRWMQAFSERERWRRLQDLFTLTPFDMHMGGRR